MRVGSLLLVFVPALAGCLSLLSCPHGVGRTWHDPGGLPELWVCKLALAQARAIFISWCQWLCTPCRGEGVLSYFCVTLLLPLLPAQGTGRCHSFSSDLVAHFVESSVCAVSWVHATRVVPSEDIKSGTQQVRVGPGQAAVGGFYLRLHASPTALRCWCDGVCEASAIPRPPS